MDTASTRSRFSALVHYYQHSHYDCNTGDENPEDFRTEKKGEERTPAARSAGNHDHGTASASFMVTLAKRSICENIIRLNIFWYSCELRKRS